MSLPREVLMCPPDYFDVIDVKNPFMQEHVGKVDRATAYNQWRELKDALFHIGLKVNLILPIPGREDMVFCANQTLTGINTHGKRLCLLSHMRFSSRQEEVPAFADWFKSHGYLVEAIGDPGVFFEGGGDVFWHPGRALLWGAIGQRTQEGIYPHILERFNVTAITLNLPMEKFYHLDTCFCPLDEQSVLIYPPAFDEAGLKLIHTLFPNVLTCSPHEAETLMACNAASFFNQFVVIQKGCETVNRALREHGLKVIEVETGEFLKSGGSVYCLKASLF